MVVSQAAGQGETVEDCNTDGDDDALTNLKTVDPSQDIDGVGAEHCQQAHVEVVEETKFNVVSQDPPKHGGHHDLRPVGGDVVDHQEGQTGHARQQQLVPPLEVQDIISKAE